MSNEATKETEGVKQGCLCIEQTNDAFQRNDDLRGIYLCTTTNLTTGQRKPIIAAERRVGKGRKAPPIIPTFCPFCGVRYTD